MSQFYSSPYVVVGRNGYPEGFTERHTAIEHFCKCLHGRFLLQRSIQELGDGFYEKLSGEGFYRKFECGYDGGVTAAAIFEARADQQVNDFVNRHIGPGRSQDYLNAAAAAWSNREGPRVGDYVTDLNGKKSRFTHDWGDSMQAGGGSDSYSMSRNGYCSYSGGLDPAVPKSLIQEVDQSGFASFWFFFDGFAGKSRALYFQLPVRNYMVIGQ